MKIGMTIEPFKGVSIKQLLFLMRLLALEHLEINFTMINEVQEFIENNKRFTATFHLPIFSRNRYDFSSNNRQYNQEIKKTVNFLNEYKEDLNLKYVLAHPPEDPNADFKKFIERLKQISTPIIIENISSLSEKRFLDYFFKIKDELQKNIAGIAFDGPHKYINKNANWLNLSKDFTREICYVHISDCTRTADLHLPLGLGEFPINDFFKFLNKINYSGIILHEILPCGGNVRDVMNSFLNCIKYYSTRKQNLMKIRYAVFEPIIQNRINQALEQISKQNNQLLLRELNYDFLKN